MAPKPKRPIGKCTTCEEIISKSWIASEILSSLHFVPYWGLASIKALVPKSLKTSEVCLKSAHLAKHWCQSVNRVLSNWAASVLQCFVYISEANQLFEVISSQVVHFHIGLLGFGAILTPNGHFEDWPPWRSDGLKSLGTWLSDTKVLYMQNLTIIRHQGPE